MMLREGINRVRDLFNTNTDQGQFGTSSTTEAYTDTALVAPVAATLVSTTSTTGTQWVIKTATVSSVLGNSNTYREFGLIRDTNDTLMGRSTFTGLAKTNLFNMRGNTRYFFK